MTLLRKAAVPPNASVDLKVFVPGRVTRARVESGCDTSAFLNVHNFEFDRDTTPNAASLLALEIEAAQQNLLHAVVWVAGDFKFLAPGDTTLSICSPSMTKIAPTAMRQHQTI